MLRRFLYIALVATLAANAQAEGRYVHFFSADNKQYEAYLDLKNRGIDGVGNPVVNVKIAELSPTFRQWIKQNYPGGETAACL
jgi:hypothetical protein